MRGRISVLAPCQRPRGSICVVIIHHAQSIALYLSGGSGSLRSALFWDYYNYNSHLQVCSLVVQYNGVTMGIFPPLRSL